VRKRKVFKTKELVQFMKQYNQKEFDSYIEAMRKISDVLRSEKPDYILAPIIGSVPLIDVLSIIDRNFPVENVEYPPNSSRFSNREEIIARWYHNFFLDNYDGGRMSLICLDEVISGSSSSKGYKEFRKSLKKFEDEFGSYLGKKINYKVLGIGETPRNHKRNHNFLKLVNNGVVKVFETKRIITSDNIVLNPLRLKRGEINKQGRQTYLPVVDKFVLTPEYLNLLHDVASYFGANPDGVSPVNEMKIARSLEKYLR